MQIICPNCGETRARTKLRQPAQWSVGTVLFAFVGGLIGGLLYELGQRSKFRCEKCGSAFFSHTTTSRICSVLCVITYAIIAAVIAYAVWYAATSRH